MEAPRSVVLVEGASDQRALEALAERRGRDLAANRVAVVAMGGAQAIGEFLERFGPSGLDVRLAGLCDAGEEGHFRRALERAGLGADLTRPKLEQLGFYVCVTDLEDELIRSLGVRRVERVLEEHGDLAALRIFQQQPDWRGRAPEEQLRRFIGTSSGRKIRMGAALVNALDLACAPRPLAGVLDHVAPAEPGSSDHGRAVSRG